MKRGFLIAALVAATLGVARPAWAHAVLESSDPAAGAVLDASPAAVTMVFTETPDIDLSTTQILDVTGTDVDVGALARGEQARSLRLEITEPLPNGTYTVAWVVVSEADGHRTAGAFAFGIGETPTEPLPQPTEGTALPSPLAVVSKVLLYAGIALLIGAAAVGTWVIRTLPARRQVLSLGAALTVAGSAGTLLAERDVLGVSLGDLLRSSTGKPFAWLALAGAATAVVAWRASRQTAPGLVLAAGAAAAGTGLIRVAGGHAAASAPVWLEIGLQWVHVLAAASWIGGLVLVLLLVRSRPDDPPVDAVARYSSFAFGAVGVLVVAGSLRAVNEIGGLGQILHLFDTGYGTALAWKVAIALLAIGAGGVNRYRSLPRLRAGGAPGTLRSVLGVEVVAAAGAFALTGLLTGLPPQGSPPPGPPAGRGILRIEGSDFATTTRVTLRVDPGTPGANTFTAAVVDFDTAAPVEADRVSLRFEPVGQPDVAAASTDLARAGDVWTAEGSQVSLAGVWQVTAQVRTRAKVVVVPLSFAMAPPGQRISVLRTPGQPDLVATRVGDAQLQAYVDPVGGHHQLHLTAFDADGNELPLARASFAAAGPEGSATTFPARRLSAGHFVADADLEPGGWMFFLDAVARDGGRLQASFEQTIT